MSAYYNEIDPQAAQWIRNLISEGVIAPGDVDERDVRDVKPVELLGYEQCHFFAGVGVWSYALRLAGWPDDRPVWTGSCPCQPFSSAGKGAGFADERHVWPYWHHLIRFCRPDVVFGEQVSSPDGLGWFDLVHADMEGEAYTLRSLDSCSAGVGAPHIRQRLWFMAYAESVRSRAGLRHYGSPGLGRSEPGDDSATHWMDDTFSDGRPARRHSDGEHDGLVATSAVQLGVLDHTFGTRLEGHARNEDDTARWAQSARHAASSGNAGGIPVAQCNRPHRAQGPPSQPCGDRAQGGLSVGSNGVLRGAGPTNGFWRAADWLRCRDERWRPVAPGSFPLAHGVAGRVGLLRGYGNAINPWNAAAVIAAGITELEAA